MRGTSLLLHAVLGLIINHVINVVFKIISIVEDVIIRGIITLLSWYSLRRHIIVEILRVVVRWAVVIQIRALALPLLLLATYIFSGHLFLLVLTI